MPQMKFNTRIKYHGEIHNGLEPFEVDAQDVPELQGRGGVLIVEPGGQDAPKGDAGQPKRGKRKAAGDGG